MGRRYTKDTGNVVSVKCTDVETSYGVSIRFSIDENIMHPENIAHITNPDSNGCYIYKEYVEKNPVVGTCINELKKLEDNNKYNPNDAKSKSCYIVNLILNIDSHWH